MTLNDLRGHLPIASRFKCDFLYSYAANDHQMWLTIYWSRSLNEHNQILTDTQHCRVLATAKTVVCITVHISSNETDSTERQKLVKYSVLQGTFVYCQCT